MFDMRALVRLILTTAHSNHQIAAMTGRSATTVRRYRQLIQGMDFSPAKLARTNDEDLERLFRSGRYISSNLYVQPDWHAVTMQLKAGRHLCELHEAYVLNVGEDAAMSYRAFCRGHQVYAASSNPIMIQRHRPGEAMMTDFAGYRPEGCNSDGDAVSFELYVAVLPASNFIFSHLVRSQTTADWLAANEAALRAFGGVPETVISDNLKAAVIKPRRKGAAAVINPAFQAFCDHYGVIARPAAPHSPKQKARVEIGVKLVQRVLRLALRNRPLMRRSEMNRLLELLVAQINHRPLRGANGETRATLYAQLDQPALRPLRQDPFSFHEVRHGLKLGPDYHLKHDQCRYSAPHTLIGQKLELRANTEVVEIWRRGESIAVHPRLFEAGGVSTNPDHMPPNHIARQADVNEDFLLWARLQGPSLQAVATAEVDRPFYGAAKSSLYRSYRDLQHRVGVSRLEAACDRAIQAGRPRFDHIRNILNRGLEFSDPAEFTTPDRPAQTNENVRGPDYFTGG